MNHAMQPVVEPEVREGPGECEHMEFGIYMAGTHFTVSKCADCGLMDVRSGEDDCNNSAIGNPWGDGKADAMLSEFVKPEGRTETGLIWFITRAQFRALPLHVQHLLNGEMQA